MKSEEYSLLRKPLLQWEGKPLSRDDCCLALRLLTERPCAFHGAVPGWEIRKLYADELKGKPAEKRKKATLTDTEILSSLITLKKRRNT